VLLKKGNWYKTGLQTYHLYQSTHKHLVKIITVQENAKVVIVKKKKNLKNLLSKITKKNMFPKVSFPTKETMKSMKQRWWGCNLRLKQCNKIKYREIQYPLKSTEVSTRKRILNPELYLNQKLRGIELN
jgi:hypothetical protein